MRDGPEAQPLSSAAIAKADATRMDTPYPERGQVNAN
jgi:hypothetical protein